MMVRVLIYGSCRGVASSRRIERATYEDVAFRYLAAEQLVHRQVGLPTLDIPQRLVNSADRIVEHGAIAPVRTVVPKSGAFSVSEACASRVNSRAQAVVVVWP
jgi:aspartate/methionine/tyrosine aminotransferase